MFECLPLLSTDVTSNETAGPQARRPTEPQERRMHCNEECESLLAQCSGMESSCGYHYTRSH